MSNCRISNIELHNFRIHKNFCRPIGSQFILISGENGSGKTSILEAISLLSPGKGLLGAHQADQNHHEESSPPLPYSINIQLNSSINIAINSEISHNKNEKNIFISEKHIQKQSDMLSFCNIVWFTAQMQHDLVQSSSHRRKFFDRLVFYLHPNHAALINKNEKLLKERLNVLENNFGNKTWLHALELQLAETGAEIAGNRVDLLKSINAIAVDDNTDHIAKIHADLLGEVEKKITEHSHTTPEIVQFMLERFTENREKDSHSRRNSFGVHRTDFSLYNHKRESFECCSSGQQKMIFLALINIVTKILQEIHSRPPIVLFDEIISFLDKKNLAHTINIIAKNSTQTWITTPVDLPLKENIELEKIELTDWA